MSIQHTFYRLAGVLATPALLLWMSSRARQGKENARSMREKRGLIDWRRTGGRVIWIHAASNGESLSILPIVRRIHDFNPDAFIVVTTGTVTSAALMEKNLPPYARHVFAPWDQSIWVNRFLTHVQPDAVIWAESELWPCMLDAVAKRGIPAFLVNARMSVRSHARWQRNFARPLVARMLAAFQAIYAQDDAEAARYKDLTNKPVINGGNVKFAASPLPYDADVLDALQGAAGDAPLWLFASAHPGEEKTAAKAHVLLRQKMKDARLVYVPRHPARGEEMARTFVDEGCRVQMRSKSAAAQDFAACDVYVADTLGELGIFFRLAPVSVVGGSFVPVGGHNPIEPALLGTAIIYGPHMHNFVAMDAMLRTARAAIQVQDASALADAIYMLLNDTHARQTMTHAARAVVETQSATIAHTIDAVAKAAAGRE